MSKEPLKLESENEANGVELANIVLDEINNMSGEEVRDFLEEVIKMEDRHLMHSVLAKFMMSDKWLFLVMEGVPKIFLITQLFLIAAQYFIDGGAVFNQGTAKHSFNEIRKHLNSVNPLEFAAISRDLSRLAKIAGNEDGVKLFGGYEGFGEDFEDPYNLGKDYYDKYVNQFQKWDDLDTDRFNWEINVNDFKPLKNKKKRSKLRGGLDGIAVAYFIKQGFLNKTRTVEEAEYLWDNYGELLEKYLPVADLVMFAAFLPIGFATKRPAFIKQIIKKFLKSKPSREMENGVSLEIVWRWPLYIKELILGDDSVMSYFVGLIRSGDMMEVHLAIYLIASAMGYIKKEKDKLDGFTHIIGKLFLTDEDWNNPELFVRVRVLAERMELSDKWKSTVEDLFLVRADQSLFPMVVNFDPNSLNKAIEEWLSGYNMWREAAQKDRQSLLKLLLARVVFKQPDEAFFRKIKAAHLPDDFDLTDQVLEILRDTSLPLLEQTQMERTGVLSNKFRVIIEPNPNGVTDLACFRIRLQFCAYDKKQGMDLKELVLDFERGQLMTKVEGFDNQLLEKLGIYFAHNYYVKHKAEVVNPNGVIDDNYDEEKEIVEPPSETEQQVEEVAMEEDSGQGDVEEWLDEEPISGIKKKDIREMDPLTLDLSDSDAKALDKGSLKLSKTLARNKDLVIQLLKGDFEHVNIDQVILHRLRSVENVEGKDFSVYQRVPVIEVLEAVINGTLSQKDWFILDKLPHMKTTGYRKIAHYPKGYSKLAPPPLWKAKRLPSTDRAREAYKKYCEAGFPKLSGFRQFEALIGITAPVQYEVGEMLVDDGERVYLTPTKRIDLNAALALKMNEKKLPQLGNEPWLDQWQKSQQRVYEQEISDIMASNMSPTMIEEEIAIRRKKIAELPPLIEKMREQSFLAETETPEGIQHHVRLTLGWVATETTFNQGTFIKLADLNFIKDKNV